MSKYRENPALTAAIAEAFGEQPKHTAAELAAMVEAEDAAVIGRLTAEIAALAVTRLGKSESAAAEHAHWALFEARQTARLFPAAGTRLCG